MLLSCPGNQWARNLINTALWIVSCLDHKPWFLAQPFNIKYLRWYYTPGNLISQANMDKWGKCAIYLLLFLLCESHFLCFILFECSSISDSLDLFRIIEKYLNRESWYIPGNWSLCIRGLVMKMSVLMQKYSFSFQSKNMTFTYHEMILTLKKTTVLMHLCKGETWLRHDIHY